MRQRHYGIDLLRCLSVLMVLILHIMGTGGVIGESTGDPAHLAAAGLVECAALCAVNCFALVSGYVGIGAKYRYRSIALLWLQVVFYLLVENVLFYFLFPGSVGIKDIIKSFLPFRENAYWYFSAYFCLFFFIPLLNRAVKALSKRQAATACGLIFVFFCVLPLFLKKDAFYVLPLGDGYSVFWLGLLYFVGGCVKEHGWMRQVRGLWLLMGYCLCVAVTVAVMLFISYTDIPIIRNNLRSSILMSYTSPTVFLCGILLLGLCAKYPRLPTPAEKVIGWLASASFGVYIIHAHPQVYGHIFFGSFEPLAAWHPLAMVAGVLLLAAGFYLLCALIDHGRLWLFDKLRLRQRLDRLEENRIGDLWKDPKS